MGSGIAFGVALGLFVLGLLLGISLLAEGMVLVSRGTLGGALYVIIGLVLLIGSIRLIVFVFNPKGQDQS